MRKCKRSRRRTNIPSATASTGSRKGMASSRQKSFSKIGMRAVCSSSGFHAKTHNQSLSQLFIVCISELKALPSSWDVAAEWLEEHPAYKTGRVQVQNNALIQSLCRDLEQSPYNRSVPAIDASSLDSELHKRIIIIVIRNNNNKNGDEDNDNNK